MKPFFYVTEHKTYPYWVINGPLFLKLKLLKEQKPRKTGEKKSKTKANSKLKTHHFNEVLLFLFSSLLSNLFLFIPFGPPHCGSRSLFKNKQWIVNTSFHLSHYKFHNPFSIEWNKEKIATTKKYMHFSVFLLNAYTKRKHIYFLFLSPCCVSLMRNLVYKIIEMMHINGKNWVKEKPSDPIRYGNKYQKTTTNSHWQRNVVQIQRRH